MKKGRRRDCKLGRGEVGWISGECRTNLKKKMGQPVYNMTSVR